jgi:hypothetical protein
MARFQTVLKSARFVYSPYTATEMQGFAQELADSIRARIQTGQNIYDQAAAPLKPGLPGRRGQTANENRAAIGFLDEAMPGRKQTASQIAFYNNQRDAAALDVFKRTGIEAIPAIEGLNEHNKRAKEPRVRRHRRRPETVGGIPQSRH